MKVMLYVQSLLIYSESNHEKVCAHFTFGFKINLSIPSSLGN